MKTNKNILPSHRIKRIREQGYKYQSDQEVSNLAIGNRFAYQLCAVLLIFGVSMASIPLLSIMLLIAFMSVILPNHPFDYIYNYFLSVRLKLPKVPPRSSQLKFACTIATVWIGGTIYLFVNNYMLQGYIAGGVFIGVALIVSTTDLCIPSLLYNTIFNKNNIKNL